MVSDEDFADGEHSRLVVVASDGALTFPILSVFFGLTHPTSLNTSPLMRSAVLSITRISPFRGKRLFSTASTFSNVILALSSRTSIRQRSRSTEECSSAILSQ